RFVSTNDFRVFGWYRIVFGIVVLALCVAGLADF
ncbi:MAG: undecaprenyl-diphosphatase, partial [Duodenibacillus sp.]|nr:undecaprenyl-diphosphatase [Duodenibacillus sp.]